MSVGFVVLAIWVFGSLCFLVGAWWATRAKDDPEPDEQELRAGTDPIEEEQSETVSADPAEPPTLQELLDQFDRIFTPKLLEERCRPKGDA